MRKGKPTISYPGVNDRPLTAELQARLEQVYHALLAREEYISVKRLSQVAGISQGRAAAFLRSKRGETTEQQGRVQSRQRAMQQRAQCSHARLQAANTRLVAQGKTPGCNLLGKEAHVHHRRAARFLLERKERDQALVVIQENTLVS